MENTSVNVVKWWTTLKPTDKLFAFMAFVIVALCTVCIKQYGEYKRLNEARYVDVIECEKRGAARAASDIFIERKRADSSIAAERKQCEIDKQNFIRERTPFIKNRTQKIENALK